jgi:hypothetical protein
MQTYAFLIKAKAKATDAKHLFAGYLQNPIPALNAKLPIFLKMQKSKPGAARLICSRFGQTGLLLMTCRKRASWTIPGATATNSTKTDVRGS